MRKFLILTLAAVLLAGMLVIPAAAEGNGAAALSDVTAKPGSTAILTLSLKDFGMANTIGVSFILPEGLTLDGEQSSWLLEGQLTDISGTQAAWAAVDAVDVDTDVLALAVNIPENAQEGDVFTVSCTVRVKNNKEVLGTADAEGRITVQVKHEHDYQETVFPPSCKEQGYSEFTCACGDSYKDGFTDPAGHLYDGDPDTRCSVCGELRTVPMHRMYDPNSGEHFYTGSDLERDFLVEAGWHYEGVGFNFPAEGAPVYRLYEPVHGEHLYTMNVAEKDKLISWGWNLEGVAFNTAGEDEVPQYRLHNPNAKRGGYHFTGSTEERDLLISLGWIDQGIGWYSCLE